MLVSDNLPIKNEGKIIALEDRVSKVEMTMDRMATDISTIKDRLLGRPTWIVTTIISILLALLTGAIVWSSTVLRLVIMVGN